MTIIQGIKISNLKLVNVIALKLFYTTTCVWKLCKFGIETQLSHGNAMLQYFLLTERQRKGRAGEYWPEGVTLRTERSQVRTKENYLGPIFPSTVESKRG